MSNKTHGKNSVAMGCKTASMKNIGSQCASIALPESTAAAGSGFLRRCQTWGLTDLLAKTRPMPPRATSSDATADFVAKRNFILTHFSYSPGVVDSCKQQKPSSPPQRRRNLSTASYSRNSYNVLHSKLPNHRRSYCIYCMYCLGYVFDSYCTVSK